jgi:hypothetical protein
MSQYEPLKTEYEVVAHENTDGLRFLVVRTQYTVVADCRTRGAAEQVARDLAHMLAGCAAAIRARGQQ